MASHGGRGRGRGGRRSQDERGEESELDPEWLPARQQQELVGKRAARQSPANGSGQGNSRGEGKREVKKPSRWGQDEDLAETPRRRAPRTRRLGESQDFLARQDVLQAAGLGEGGGAEQLQEDPPNSPEVDGGSPAQRNGNTGAGFFTPPQQPVHTPPVENVGANGGRGDEAANARHVRGRGRGRGRGGRGGYQQGRQEAGAAGEGEGEHDGQGGDGSQDQVVQPLPLAAAFDLPTMEELHSTYIPTQKHVPKAARGDFARELSSLWHNLASDMADERLWQLESMFARCMLPACKGKRIADAYSQSRIVKERLRRWRGGEYRQLWDEAVDMTKKRPKAKKRRGEGEEKTAEERNAERAKVLAGEGEYARAIQALCSAGMAPHNATTEAELKAKHPQAQVDMGPLPTTDASPLTITQMEVDKSVRKFGRGKAPGPSGMRPEHMKIIHQGAQNRRDRALAGLTRLVNGMVKGEVPEPVAPYLSGARLHAGLKKDGSIRPIAVGNLLRRLVGRCVARSLADRAAQYLSPLQTGVGVRGGCEAIVHAARAALEKHPDKWLLQVDFINAFNCADRGSTLAEVARLFPEMLAWCTTCYGQPSHMQYGKTRISSTSGWHQGDALAALLFSLTLHPLALMIKEQVPGLDLNTWFLDDGTQVGTLEELQQVVDIIEREGPRLGLHLSTSATSNRPKSTVWSPLHYSTSVDDPLQRGVPVERSNGVTLLGAPVGDARHLEEAIKRKVEKIGQVTAKLPLLKDPQTEYVLLRSCLALPKISFLL